MNYKRITAIISDTSLEKVEENLVGLGVNWITVSKNRGHGEHRDYYQRDCMTDCIRIEIFIESDKAKCIADAICYAAYEGTNSDGMVAISPVEEFMLAREFKRVIENV